MNAVSKVLEKFAGVDAGGHEIPRPVPDLSERIVARMFEVDRKIVKPAPVFSVNGIGISTAGNLTAVSGGPKSGKTAVVAAMLASYCTRTQYHRAAR